jgi:hypothetical protein
VILPAEPAPLRTTSRPDDQQRVFIAETPHQIALARLRPAVSAQKLLLAIRAGIARRFRSHPASLARFFVQQFVNEPPTLVAVRFCEQRAHATTPAPFR